MSEVKSTSTGAVNHNLADQQALAAHYSRLLASPAQFADAPDDLGEFKRIRAIEDAWNVAEEQRISTYHLPETPTAFRDWYFEMYRVHTNEVAPFFEFLATDAAPQDLAFYICLEEMVDGHFDDVIALSQLGMPTVGKLAMARNYWDEMGCGNAEDIHTAMFAVSADYMKEILRRGRINLPNVVPVEGLKNANMLLMYALRRRFTPRLLGAIGILEHTASERFAATVKGLRRIGAPEHVVRYHEAHVHFDADHGAEWLDDVLIPMIGQNKAVMREICVGILIRFHIAADYYAAAERQIRGGLAEQRLAGAAE